MNSSTLVQLEIEDFVQVHGKDWRSLWPSESHEALQAALDQARSAAAASLTVLRPTFKKTRRWWNVSVSPVRNSAKEPIVRILVVSHDVTEAREVEQTLRRSDEQKDNFIATLAHELRNPWRPFETPRP